MYTVVDFVFDYTSLKKMRMEELQQLANLCLPTPKVVGHSAVLDEEVMGVMGKLFLDWEESPEK